MTSVPAASPDPSVRDTAPHGEHHGAPGRVHEPAVRLPAPGRRQQRDARPGGVTSPRTAVPASSVARPAAPSVRTVAGPPCRPAAGLRSTGGPTGSMSRMASSSRRSSTTLPSSEVRNSGFLPWTKSYRSSHWPQSVAIACRCSTSEAMTRSRMVRFWRTSCISVSANLSRTICWPNQARPAADTAMTASRTSVMRAASGSSVAGLHPRLDTAIRQDPPVPPSQMD